MATHIRILNVTKGFYMKLRAVEKAIDACSVTWVEEGVSIRCLTLAEAIEARNKQAKLREPLPYSEINGVKFDPPASGVVATRAENRLVYEAHQFARQAA